MEQATVLLIDSDNSTLKKVIEKDPTLAVVGSTANIDIAYTLAERNEPAVIMLNVDLPGEECFQAAEAFTLEFPASSLIMLTAGSDPEVLRQALKVGAKEVIFLPVDDEQLIKTIKQVLKQDLKRRQLFSIEKKTKPEFKIITAFNTKGGVGKSTLALNVALAIRQKTKSRVVLVDLDLFSGNLALMAGVDSRISIKDMVDDINILDKENLDEYCVSHKSGLKIVPAPITPETAGFIRTDHVEKILGLLTEVFNYVVVDAPTYFTDAVIPALEMAQDILVVSTLDLASAQNLKQCLDLLDRLAMLPKTRLVVNRVGYTGALKIKDLEQQLGLAANAIIPECEKVAIDAVNMGEPLMISAPNAPCTQQMRALAEGLVTDQQKKRFRFGPFGK